MVVREVRLEKAGRDERSVCCSPRSVREWKLKEVVQAVLREQLGPTFEIFLTVFVLLSATVDTII